MSIGISGCSRDPKPEMLARAAALGRALAPRGAVVAGRRQLMVASPNLLQEAAAKAASDPHVNCFKMATDGADPVMCAPLRAAGAADASSACLLRPGRPCTIALDSMRRLLLRCCRVRPCPFGGGGGGRCRLAPGGSEAQAGGSAQGRRPCATAEEAHATYLLHWIARWLPSSSVHVANAQTASGPAALPGCLTWLGA